MLVQLLLQRDAMRHTHVVTLASSLIKRSLATTNKRLYQNEPDNQTNISYSERQIFKDNATKWWTGKEFALLRGMNELRIPLIKNGLLEKQGKRGLELLESSATPLTGFKIIDVGCGGGILSEPLARLGASVLGIDPVHESIIEAQQHAQLNLTDSDDRLEYRNCNIEDVVGEPKNIEAYDAVVASEVLEHIRDIEPFLQHCTKAIRPNGSLFLTTINQTPLAYLGVILFGEYILKQLPKGTHTYDMFVNLVGLKIMLERMGYHLRLVNGFMYEPITGTFMWTPTTLTHYAIHAIKSTPQLHNKSSNNNTIGQSSSTSVNFEQRRNYSARRGKASTKARPKVDLSDDEMLTVVQIETYRLELKSILDEVKDNFDKNLTSRMALLNVDNVEIDLARDANEMSSNNKNSNKKKDVQSGNLFKLKDIAQITRKGSNLIVINLAAMPEALKPALEALTELGNTNPQVEGSTIYIPIPKVTREHREKLVLTANRATTKAKSEIKVLFASYSSKAKRQQTKAKLSEDLVRNTIDCMQCEMYNSIDTLDRMLKTKTEDLLDQTHS